jgi:hypothetical protein
MARKPRKGTEWEILVVKAIFALIGAVLGAIFFGFSRVVAWGYSDEKFVVMASLGFVIGGIVGWFWASKEPWQD